MMINIISSFMVLGCIISTEGQAGWNQEHCCQNKLCPIDCVRCDGKATCYDLSDELGCSEAMDKHLLSFQKPPVFVPIIIDALMVQLRREKVGLSYRYPDRDCFKPVTHGPVPSSHPSYRLMGISRPVPTTTTTTATTTETPIWLQLLTKLKESIGITTAATTTITTTSPSTSTSSTTSEIPLWKMLLKILRAQQNGAVITTTPSVKYWYGTDLTTTMASSASYTSPWRQTGRPLTSPAQMSEQTSTHPIRIPITVEQATTQTPNQTNVPPLHSASYAEQVNGDITTTFSPEQSTIVPKTENTTGIANITSAYDEISVKPKLATVKTKMNIIVKTTSMKNDTIATNITMITSAEIPSSMSIATTTTPTSIVSTENVTQIKSGDVSTDLVMNNVATFLNMNEAFNKTEIPTSIITTPVNVTNEPYITTQSTIQEVDTTRNSTQGNIPDSYVASTEQANVLINATENTIIQYQTQTTDTEAVNESQLLIVGANNTQQNSSIIYSATTGQLELTTTELLGVTLSTEHVNIISETESQAPIQQKIVTPLPVNISTTINISRSVITSNSDVVDSLTGINDQKRDKANVKLDILSENINMSSHLSEMSKAVENLLAEKLFSNSSLVPDLGSSNDTSVTLGAYNTSTNNDTSVLTGFELYNNTIVKDRFKRFNGTENADSTFVVSIVEKQDNSKIKVLKDKMADKAIKISPETEVRIMLGKLNTLVRSNVAFSNFALAPLLGEYSTQQPEATVHIQSSISTPPVVMETSYKTPVTQTTQTTMDETKPARVTQLPGWPLTTNSQYFFDNLFGFTIAPPFSFGQNWFNPVAGDYLLDSMFGTTEVPMPPSTSISTRNDHQGKLNNIYDPLLYSEQSQVQDATTIVPSPITRDYSPTITITPSSIDIHSPITGANNSASQTIKPITNTLASLMGILNTNSYNTQTDPPVAKLSDIFKPFDPVMIIPRNLSITKEQATQGQTTVRQVPLSNTRSVISKFSGVITRPNQGSLYNTISKAYTTTSDSPTRASTKTPITEKHTLQHIQPRIEAIAETAKPIIQASTPELVVPERSTQTPVPISTSIVSNWWNPSVHTVAPVKMITTESVPSTRPAIPTSVTSVGPSSNSNRVLSSDNIFLWWAQVHPSTQPPYIAPTTLASPGVMEHCYEVLDLTGFCQSRNTGNFKNPTDCRSFYVCIWGFLHRCACPPNTMFDELVKVCNWDTLVTCK